MTTEEKYRKVIEEILLAIQYNPSQNLPDWFVVAVGDIINKNDITVISYEAGQALAITCNND